jgi:hypothetical protein
MGVAIMADHLEVSFGVFFDAKTLYSSNKTVEN